jgi:hypothetical protein
MHLARRLTTCDAPAFVSTISFSLSVFDASAAVPIAPYRAPIGNV